MSQYLSVCSAIRAMLSAYLLIIIIQMNSECQNINCLQQMKNLASLLQSARREYVLEIKQIEESLELFAKNKREECANLQMIADKLAFKVEKYKSRCCNLNDRIKQENQIIKSLNSRISSLESALKQCKDQISREKDIQYNQVRIMSELKQTITLQQSQVKELSLKVSLQSREIQNFCTQLAKKKQFQNRFMNVQCISEEQYQRETALLRETLKLQFNKSTSDLFDFPSPRKEKDFLQETRKFTQSKQNQYQNQLRILANTLQYGSSYIILVQAPYLALSQSQSILKAYQSLVSKSSQNQQQIAKLRETNQILLQGLRAKLNQIEQNIEEQQKKTCNVSTQTPFKDAIGQLTQTNSILRIKMLELSQFIETAVHFTAYLYHLGSYERQKLKYYKKIVPKKKGYRIGKRKFKQIALSVLFIQYLSKKARKTKLNHENMSFLQILNVGDSRLQLLLLKCLTLKQTYDRKNPVIQRLLKQKAKISSESILISFSQMIQQEAIGISLSKNHQSDTEVFRIQH